MENRPLPAIRPPAAKISIYVATTIAILVGGIGLLYSLFIFYMSIAYVEIHVDTKHCETPVAMMMNLMFVSQFFGITVIGTAIMLCAFKRMTKGACGIITGVVVVGLIASLWSGAAQARRLIDKFAPSSSVAFDMREAPASHAHEPKLAITLRDYHSVTL